MSRSSPRPREFSSREKFKNAYGGSLPPPDLGNAVRAWRDGEASPEQQRLLWRYVVEIQAGLVDPEFAKPNTAENVNWYNGRRSVGLQLNELASTPIKSTI